MFGLSGVLSSLVLASITPVLADVSQSTLDDLRYYSQYSAQVFCAPNTDPSQTSAGQQIACLNGNSCPEVQSSSARYIASVYNDGFYDLAANLVHDPVKNKIVLSFRGATSDEAGASQTNSTMIACPTVCADCKCHGGFYAVWETIKPWVTRELRPAIAAHPKADLVVTGLSLGAILAILAAGEIRASGCIIAAKRVSLYTYGQPRVGDEAFSRAVTQQGNNFRVTHTDDPGCRIGDVKLGYRHISPEYWIKEDSNLVDYAVTTSNVQVLEGFHNCSGNGGTGGQDIPAHWQYFQAQLPACHKNMTRTPGLPYSLGGDQGGMIPGDEC